jgi:SPP1 gp7 family putative phage head morphogenesis protein
MHKPASLQGRLKDLPQMRETQWKTEFKKGIHHPTLKRAIDDTDKIIDKEVDRLGQSPLPSHFFTNGIKDKIRPQAFQVTRAGAEWAKFFIPPGKTAALRFDWNVNDDIDQLVHSLKEVPSPGIKDIFHETIGRGKGPPIQELEKMYGADRAKTMARTVFLNIYAKASLREADKAGYTDARRMEINDHKVCPVCKALNNKIYPISPLVGVTDPLTRDAHPNCRGLFVPAINSITYQPESESPLEHRRDVVTNGNTITGVPIEFVPWMRNLSQKTQVPFPVVFDVNSPKDYHMKSGTLVINPRTLIDEDPRHIVLETMAVKAWPTYKSKFESEYLLLVKCGLAQPAKTFEDTLELWIDSFVDWKLNQLDDFYEIAWFKANVKA